MEGQNNPPEPDAAQFLSRNLEELQSQFASLQTQHLQLLQALQSQPQQPPLSPPRPQWGSLKPIRPPTFKGDVGRGSKIEDWLYQVNAYFELVNVSDEACRIQFAASLLEEHAARWYRLRVQSGPPFNNWTEFQQALFDFFRPINAVKRARDKLAELQQTNTVRLYVQKFTELCLEIPDLNETERLYRFVRGLRLEVRREVDLHDPQNFNEAAKIAERYDSIVNHKVNFGNRKPYNPMYFPKNGGLSKPRNVPQPMEIDVINTRRNDQSRNLPPKRPPVCYLCKKTGHLLADCPEWISLRKEMGNAKRPTTKN